LNAAWYSIPQSINPSIPALAVLGTGKLQSLHMEESGKKKKLLSRWELFILIVVVFLILYFILQKFGINMMEVTEDSEIIQKPHQ
jgi:hypothetical protein